MSASNRQPGATSPAVEPFAKIGLCIAVSLGAPSVIATVYALQKDQAFYLVNVPAWVRPFITPVTYAASLIIFIGGCLVAFIGRKITPNRKIFLVVKS
ncbi:hypothetical protein [Kozakia baliensis]|uniref:hypothetical protein n=1 Tax=Kozakia baliensis TaxID=153496 RepID=UPI0011E0624B|nr:hypothetical protein [Kozakia baliensis]